MSEKRIGLLASVKEREQQLKVVINSLYKQVDEIHLILNYYDAVPKWLYKNKIFTYCNPTNKNAHDSIWNHVWQDGYYLILDDDLLYPIDYFDKLIETIERHERRAVVTAHGTNIKQPVKDWFSCRNTYGFSDILEQDIYVDVAGVGTTAFHSSTFNVLPTLQDFPVPFCRDLYFSIFCKKNNVPIISPQRSYGWILPLKVPGDTVYDTTCKNESLKRIKNRILKEQLLPFLFCDRNNEKYCLITDYDFDEQLMKKSLETLTKVSNCNKIVFSNKAKDYGKNILTQYVIPEEVEIGRAGSKIITHFRFINGLPEGSKVISADADLYYLKDPFIAFEQDFDIAVTTRPEKYHYPINQGMVMFRTSKKLNYFLDFLMSQIFERTWPELIQWQKRFNHQGNDWCIGQDMMCVAWLCRDEIQKRFNVKIVDIGSYWNFCPHADGAQTEQGKQKLMDAYNNKSVAVLHLKSRLKELLLDGLLE